MAQFAGQRSGISDRESVLEAEAGSGTQGRAEVCGATLAPRAHRRPAGTQGY